MKNIFKAIFIALLFLGCGIGISKIADAAYTDVQSFYRATLTSSISSSATTINVSTAPTVTTGYFVIEPRTSNQEIVKMTSRSGTALTVVRGLSATSSSPVDAGYKRAHAAGSAVEMVDVHYYLRELQGFTGGLTVDSPTLVVDTTNHRIGMGTTTPAALLHIDSASSTGRVIFDRDAGNPFIVSFRTDNKPRWAFRVDGTESGTSTGSDFAIRRYDDTGTFVDAPIYIVRSSGYIGIGTSTPAYPLTVNGLSQFLANVNLGGYKITNLGTPTDQTDAATKDYADNIAIAGGVTASNIVTGIQRVASSTQITSGYSSSTAYAIPSSLASSTASTSPIVVVTKEATGKIDPSFLNGTSEAYTFNGTTTLASSTQIASYPIYGEFGDGRDGNVTINAGATTTLSRDMYYNNLTINGDLVTGNYRVYVKDTVSGSGRFMQDGNAGGNGGNSGCGGGNEGGPGGTAGAAISGYFTTYAGLVGGNGGSSGNVGFNGQNATTSIGVNGSASASGQTGGVSSTSTVFGILSWQTLTGLEVIANGSTLKLLPNAQSASANGGANNGGTGCEGAGAGGTGSGGGMLWLVAKNWAGTFTMQAKGGNGGNGGNSSNTGTGRGHGGSGGPGGTAVTIYGNKTWTGTYTLTGGVGGTAGTGTADAGTNGVNGITGVSYEIPLFRLLK